MNAKTRAFFYNFLSFGLIFITFRFGLNYFFTELNHFLASVIAGIASVFLAPRFGAFEKQGRQIVLMKWIFLKDVKEV